MTTCTCDTHTSTTTSPALNVSNTGGGEALNVTSSSNAQAINVSNTNTGGSATGVYSSASSTSAPAVWGDGGWCGTYGKVYNASSMGARGESTSTAGGHGVFGCSQASTGSGHGVYGYSSDTNGNNYNAGVCGYGFYGVYGTTPFSNGTSIYANSPQYATSLFAVCDGGQCRGGYAGYFVGNVYVNGWVTKSGGGFLIDHPADPENKYLNHCFVESPEMLNIFRGRATFDANGEAAVALPDYFSLANESIEYTFAPIGSGMPNLHISEELSGNTFKLAGGTAGKSVSWQVSAARADKWAKKNFPGVEIAKTDSEKGKFLHPDLFGKDASAHVNPNVVKSLNAPGATFPEVPVK